MKLSSPLFVAGLILCACGTAPVATPTPLTGLRAALLQPSDIPGSPQSNNQFSIEGLLCVAPTTGAIAQVEVDYPVGPQTGPQPGLLINIVIQFSDDNAQKFIAAEKAKFDTCTSSNTPAPDTAPPAQPQPPQAGDDTIRHVYTDCDRFGCMELDYLFVRKGQLVSVIVNSSSVIGQLDPNLTAQLAQRDAVRLGDANVKQGA